MAWVHKLYKGEGNAGGVAHQRQGRMQQGRIRHMGIDCDGSKQYVCELQDYDIVRVSHLRVLLCIIGMASVTAVCMWLSSLTPRLT